MPAVCYYFYQSFFPLIKYWSRVITWRFVYVTKKSLTISELGKTIKIKSITYEINNAIKHSLMQVPHYSTCYLKVFWSTIIFLVLNISKWFISVYIWCYLASLCTHLPSPVCQFHYIKDEILRWFKYLSVIGQVRCLDGRWGGGL